mgnify:FL=1
MNEKTPAGKSSFANLPNQITVARLALSLVFFILLGIVGHGTDSETRQVILNWSTALFMLAMFTDFLDGYLARKWNIESTFGRIADPFVDKIVICGSFILLTTVSDFVEPWYPLVIVFREFLVSGLRSYIESAGVAFGAAWAGKVKLAIQGLTIPALLFYEANFVVIKNGAYQLNETSFWPWLQEPLYWLTFALLTATLISTFYSCVVYLRKAARILRG